MIHEYEEVKVGDLNLIKVMSIIDEAIENIPNGKILNTDFREFIVMMEDYYLCVYPFVYILYKYIDMDFDKDTFKYYEFSIKSEIIFVRHIDYTNKMIKYDPCDIFEIVSGHPIHTEEDFLEYDILDKVVCKQKNEMYAKNFKTFEQQYKYIRRTKKLKRIINE